MSGQHIVRHTLVSLSKIKGKTDWARVDTLTDKEIERAIKDDPDAAPLLDEQWFRHARLIEPERKKPVSLRLDPDIVEWFKRHTKRYQSSINAVLKTYVRAQTEPRRRLAAGARLMRRRHRRKPK